MHSAMIGRNADSGGGPFDYRRQLGAKESRHGQEGKEKIMKEKDLYRSYPYEESYIRRYVGYQQKYSSRIRESDRVIIEIVAGVT